MLKRLLRKMAKRQSGFTLIELLVVVAILGVLAAVITPNVIKFMDSGKVAAVAGNEASIQTAVDAYVADGAGHKYADVEQASSATVPALLIPTYLRAQPDIGHYAIVSGTVTGVYP